MGNYFKRSNLQLNSRENILTISMPHEAVNLLTLEMSNKLIEKGLVHQKSIGLNPSFINFSHCYITLSYLCLYTIQVYRIHKSCRLI